MDDLIQSLAWPRLSAVGSEVSSGRTERDRAMCPGRGARETELELDPHGALPRKAAVTRSALAAPMQKEHLLGIPGYIFVFANNELKLAPGEGLAGGRGKGREGCEN